MPNIMHILQALTILPFAHLSYIAPPTLFNTITCVWVSSFTYHLSLSVRKYELAHILFLANCISQISAIGALINITDDYTTPTKIIASTIMYYFIFCIPFQTNKENIHYLTINAHITNVLLGLFFATNRYYYYNALTCLAFASILYPIPYMWTLGHIFCYYYTYYSWLALGVAR